MSWSSSCALALSCLAACLAACLDGEPPPAVGSVDLGFFQAEIQPIFDRSCAFTACHGDPGRAFFVYSMSKRRIVADELLGECLTDKELCANFSRTAAFVTADPQLSQLLTKPATLDGYASQFHEGNYLFGLEDPEARCLVRWMQGEALANSASTAPSLCELPWRAVQAARALCPPHVIDCEDALRGPDLPEVGG